MLPPTEVELDVAAWRRLAAAILAHAAAEALGYHRPGRWHAAPDLDPRDPARLPTWEETADARQWFMDDSPRFRAIVRLAGRDPAAVRRRVLG